MEFTATQPVEGDAFARTATGLPPETSAQRDVSSLFAWIRRPGELLCSVVSRAELRNHPVWRSTFAASRKDHRYYEILEDTVQDRFDYKYFLITDDRGEALAVQPFFVMDQDMLEGVASLSRAMTGIRKLFPRFLMMRTLMVGCTAGEGHLAASPRISAAEIGKALAANVVRHAKTLKAAMVVMKEFPSPTARRWIHFWTAASAGCPACRAVSLDVTHANFDEFMQKELRANARRHLKKNLAVTKGSGITMQVTSDPGLVPRRDSSPLSASVREIGIPFREAHAQLFPRIAAEMGDKVRFFTWRRGDELIACSLSWWKADAVPRISRAGLPGRARPSPLPLYVSRPIHWAVKNGMTRSGAALGYDPKLHLRFKLAPSISTCSMSSR